MVKPSAPFSPAAAAGTLLMLTGIALPLSDMPSALIAQHDLAQLVHDRAGEREARFLFAAAERLLPVQHVQANYSNRCMPCASGSPRLLGGKTRKESPQDQLNRKALLNTD